MFFLSLLLKFYWSVPLAMIGVTVLAWKRVWALGRTEDLGAQALGHGVVVPNAPTTEWSSGWWGSVFLLTANATFFGSLLFVFAFLCTIALGWPPPVWVEASVPGLSLGILGAVAGPVAIRLAIRRNRKGGTAQLAPALTLASAIALALACADLMARAPAPTGHAYCATLFVLGSYGLFHAALIASFLMARVRHGYISAGRRAELGIVRLWVDYGSVIGLMVLLAAHLQGFLP